MAVGGGGKVTAEEEIPRMGSSLSSPSFLLSLPVSLSSAEVKTMTKVWLLLFSSTPNPFSTLPRSSKELTHPRSLHYGEKKFTFPPSTHGRGFFFAFPRRTRWQSGNRVAFSWDIRYTVKDQSCFKSTREFPLFSHLPICAPFMFRILVLAQGPPLSFSVPPAFPSCTIDRTYSYVFQRQDTLVCKMLLISLFSFIVLQVFL